MIIMISTKNLGLDLDYKTHMIFFFDSSHFFFFFFKYACPKLPSIYDNLGQLLLYMKKPCKTTYISTWNRCTVLKKKQLLKFYNF